MISIFEFGRMPYAPPCTDILCFSEEENFTATTGGLQDMDPNPLYEDEFDD